MKRKKIQNEEVRGEFVNAMEESGWQAAMDAINASEELLDATCRMDEEQEGNHMNQNEAGRFEIFYHILDQWLSIRQKKRTLVPYFEDNLISHAAVYGMGALGERLVDELKDTPIQLSYAIDRMAKDKMIEGLTVFGLDEFNYPRTQLLVVTPVHDYWKIVELLKDKIHAPIVSLEDVVGYCWHKG